MNRKRRATPLAPEERRNSIVASVIPLLLEQRSVPTTAEMAEAAGVAEGTIFSVFPDKVSVLHEAILASLDPDPTCAALGEVFEGATLERQLGEAARILLERMEKTIALMDVLRSMPTHPRRGGSDIKSVISESNRRITESIVRIFEGHEDEMTMAPDRAAIAFRSLVFASGHPVQPAPDRLTVDEIVAIVTAAVRRPQAVS